MNTTKQAQALTLKKEWTPKDFKTVERAIFNYFKRTFVNTMHPINLNFKCFNDVDAAFGFAYTSTSMFAMYSICNTEVYFDYFKKWNFVCFGLAEGNSGFVYALLHDENENEIYFPIN